MYFYLFPLFASLMIILWVNANYVLLLCFLIVCWNPARSCNCWTFLFAQIFMIIMWLCGERNTHNCASRRVFSKIIILYEIYLFEINYIYIVLLYNWKWLACFCVYLFFRKFTVAINTETPQLWHIRRETHSLDCSLSHLVFYLMHGKLGPHLT